MKTKIKKIIKITIIIIITISIFCFIMKNFFPAEWSFITPHKQGDFVRVGDTNNSANSAKTLLLDNGNILVVGFYGAEIYDYQARRFKQITIDKKLFDGFVNLIELDNKTILITGEQYSYMYSPQQDISKGSEMIFPRKNNAVLLLNSGKVFVVGGMSSDNKADYKNFKFTEFYNPKNNQFEKGPDLPVALPYTHQIIQLRNYDIYVFGCTYVDEYKCEERIYKLVNNSDKFEYVSKLPTHSHVFKLKSEKMIMFSTTDRNNGSPQVTIFNPKTNEIESHSLDLPNGYYAETILLPDDTLLFIGGSSGFGMSFRQYKMAKIYNPETNEFKTLEAKPNFPRNGHSVATLMRDGNILIMGGNRKKTDPLAAEIYMFNNKIEQ